MRSLIGGAVLLIASIWAYSQGENMNAAIYAGAFCALAIFEAVAKIISSANANNPNN
jgi:hypothetical protein